MSTSLRRVSPRYAYLGPVGTFTESALHRVAGPPPEGAGSADSTDRVAFASVDAALDAVRTGACEIAVVPIENSVEGGVTATLDALAAGPADTALVIVGEVLVPVTFVLAARAGTALADVTRVASHPHALAQCRTWLATHLPRAATATSLSTSAAAQALAEGAGAHDAALCAAAAADAFGLAVLATGVADRAGAVTRFVLVSRPGPVPAPTGADKTTVVVQLSQDRAGALLDLLEQFATRGVNMTRIESRPVGSALGQYSFSIDCEGHVADPRVGEALMGLRRVTADLRFLGSYPRADGGRTTAQAGTADADFTDARAWLDAVLAGGPRRP